MKRSSLGQEVKVTSGRHRSQSLSVRFLKNYTMNFSRTRQMYYDKCPLYCNSSDAKCQRSRSYEAEGGARQASFLTSLSRAAFLITLVLQLFDCGMCCRMSSISSPASGSLQIRWDPKNLDIRTKSVEKTLEPLVTQVNFPVFVLSSLLIVAVTSINVI